MSDAEFLQEVKRYVQEIDPLAEVWLFGSRARGDAREDSDWDFLVLTNQLADWTFKRQLRGHLYDIGYANSQVISTIIQSKKHSPLVVATDLYQNVLNEGKRL